MSNGKYYELFNRKGFFSFLTTQFLGAFNDNVFKFIVGMYAIVLAGGDGSRNTSIVGMVFALPFILFSGYSGRLADVYSKRNVLIITKSFEILAMGLGFFAMVSGNLNLMLVVLFMMGMHSTFFSPAKYGILPEMLEEKDLSRANGLLEMTTFMAIILGTSLGGILFTHWSHNPGRLNLVLLAVAVVGTLISFGIPKVPRSGAQTPFKLNPFNEIGRGVRDLWKDRDLWLTNLGICYFWFLGALLQLELLLLGEEVMKLDPTHTALLGAGVAIGIGVGSAVAGKLSGDKVELGLVPLGSIGLGLFSILLFNSSHQGFMPTMIMLSLLGFSGGFFIVPLNALLQQKAGKEEKGRIMATNSFMSTLGVFLAAGMVWVFGDLFHLQADRTLEIFGFLTLGATAYILTVLPVSLVRFVLWVFTHSIYRVKVVGQENVPFEGPALFVCNHVTWVDGFLVGTSTQRLPRFMMWKPYYDHPLLHWFFKLMGAIPTAGRNRQEVLQSLEVAREELKKGEVVCIFAEGGLSRTGNMMPFKRGFERIMEGVEVPIIPVHLDRVWGSIFSYKDGRFFLKWPQRVPFPVTVSFGKPMPSTTKAHEVRQTVMELGSNAVAHRQTEEDVLPFRFLRTAKRNLFSFCMADSMGKKMTFGQTLTAGLLFSRWVEKNRPEDKMIGLLLPSTTGGALANLGVSLSGKVPVNLNFTAGKDSMQYAVTQCGIKTILTSKVFLHKAGLEPMEGMVYLEDLVREFTPLQKALAALEAYLSPSWLVRKSHGFQNQKPGDLATVIFSSGSTGTPKGVMLSHYNILSNLEACEQLFWVTKQDRMMGVLPFFHSFGFMGTLWFPLVAGFGAVYHPNPVDAKTIGEMIYKYKATILISTPTFYSAYIRKCAPEQFATIRFPVVGAEKLRASIAAEYKEKFGRDLMEGYGCTEMSPAVAVNIPDFENHASKQKGMKPGTVGQPIPGVAVQIVQAETGLPLSSGEEGLILVRGSNRMMGYLGAPEKTAEVVKDGWYTTGDIGMLDEEGFLHITDRLSRFSKIAGEMVPHLKVEEAIHPILGEYVCAVTSIPDEQKGEKLVVIHTHPQLTPESFWNHLSGTELPKLWVPKKEYFYFVESLPSLGSGKLDLKGLKQLALNFSAKIMKSSPEGA